MRHLAKILIKVAEELSNLPTDPSERVRQAIENIERVDPDYFTSTVKQRLPQSGSAAGSIYENMSEQELVAKLKSATWKPFNHPSIGGPAKGFSAQIEGRVGVVSVNDVPQGSRFQLDDRKNTGQVSLVVSGKSRGPRVGHTVILLGPAGQDDPTEIVWTFHPGDPIRPSMVSLKDSEQQETKDFVEKVNRVLGASFSSPQELHEAVRRGISVSRKQALELGFESAKIED